MKHFDGFTDIPLGVSETMAQIELSKEPIVVMGIGVASCKPAVLEDLAWRLGPHINTVSFDGIHERLTLLHAGKAITELQEIEVYRQVKQSLDDHNIAIVDGSYSGFRDRIKDINGFSRLSELGKVTTGAFFIDTDPDVEAQNDDGVAPSRHLEVVRSLKPNQPALHEGFDWIVAVIGTEVSTITAAR